MSAWDILVEPRAEDAGVVSELGDEVVALLASGIDAPDGRSTADVVASIVGEALPREPAEILTTLDAAVRGHRLLTAAAAAWSADTIAIAWVGDVRAHLVRGGQLVTQTLDHSFARQHGITDATAARITTRALGGPDATVETARWEARRHDTLVLCAPHLHDVAAPARYLPRAIDRRTITPGRIVIARRA